MIGVSKLWKRIKDFFSERWRKIVATGWWSVLTVFAWELVEEALENLIAYGISSVVALFITKALSTLAIITATQGIKIGVKKMAKFINPYIKTLIYKEGNDKMNLVNKYFTKVWGNKITGLFSGVTASLCAYWQPVFPVATGCWWFALLVGILFFNLAIMFGGETVKQIIARFAEEHLTKEQKRELKKIEHAERIVKEYEESVKILSQKQNQQ